VFSAIDRDTGKMVAVKIARTDTPDAHVALRLKREAEVLDKADSPFLVRHVTSGRDAASGLFCLVEELVKGIPLTQLIGTDSVSLRSVAAIVHQIAQGLHAVHSAGLIMRDLHPGQVMVDFESNPPQVKLIDLGLSKSFRDDLGLTDPEQMAGTPGYTAPELATGASPTPSADTYSLAAITAAMLSGEAPYAGFSPEIIVAQQMVSAPTALGRPPDLPDAIWMELRRLLTLSLDPDPARRPQTPTEFSRILSSIVGSTRTQWAPPAMGMWLIVLGTLAAAGLAVWLLLS